MSLSRSSFVLPLESVADLTLISPPLLSLLGPHQEHLRPKRLLGPVRLDAGSGDVPAAIRLDVDPLVLLSFSCLFPFSPALPSSHPDTAPASLSSTPSLCLRSAYLSPVSPSIALLSEAKATLDASDRLSLCNLLVDHAESPGSRSKEQRTFLDH